MNKWYSISAKGEELEIAIHDEIGGWGIQVSDFAAELRRYPNAKSISLSIHSPGGSALDGLAIYNMLKDHPARVIANVPGIAASAATTILMAADHITIPEDAFLMIHNPWGGVMGEASDMREYADVLDKIRNSMANIYAKRSGQEMEAVLEVMDNETWLTAAEAVEMGYADEMTDAIKVAALSKDFAKHFGKLPEALKKADIEINSLKDAETHLRDVGRFSNAQAKSFVSQLKQILQRDVANDAVAKKALEAAFDRISALSVPTSLKQD